MAITNYKSKNDNLNKILKAIRKENEDFFDNYSDYDVSEGELLHKAIGIITLQEEAIKNLLVKLKTLEKNN